MHRRDWLAALATAGTGVAGCLTDSTAADSGPRQTARPTGKSGTTDRPPLGYYGVPSSICSEPVADDPGIAAVTEPAFGDDWTGRSVREQYRALGSGEGTGIAGDHTVIGLGDGADARAYPLGILRYHEIVNDTVALGDTHQPALVTYCPLCRSGMVARRVVAGDTTTFLVSGLLWVAPRLRSAAAERGGTVFGAASAGRTPSVRNSGNLVMYDRNTESYWSQILARAICGPLAGTRLEVLPSSVATWADWRSAHPDGSVLLPPPHSETATPVD